MLNKLQKLMRQYDMVAKGDHVVCAVSGGADSVALLFGMYLLREKLGITVSAAHFKQLIVVATLYNFAVFKHHNRV